MKRYFQAYHMFLPRSCVLIKILIYGIYPLCSILLSLMAGILTAGMLLLFLELIIEFFTFSGIASKDGIRLEYIKSSPQGIRLIKMGLTVNALRRMATIFLVYAVSYVVSITTIGDDLTGSVAAGKMITAALVTILLTEAATMVTKFFSGLYVTYCTGGVAFILQILSFLGVFMSQGWSVLPALLLGISDAAIIFFGRDIVMGRIRRSYYDE